METKFNFKSAICTSREQSERLLALGLKKETADCVWIEMSKDDWRVDANGWKAYHSIIEEGISPAWSLHRLIEMYVERYISCSMNLKDLTYEWIINEIEIQIKEGDFNKGYLEE